jgi:hypothetical protein
VLAWFLEKAMRENKTFLPVYQIQDKRRKADRIVQALGGRSAYGKLWCKASQIKFLEQFTEYSPTYGGHDDVLDAVAMGITWGTNQSAGDWLDGEYERIDETDVPKLSFRAAP